MSIPDYGKPSEAAVGGAMPGWFAGMGVPAAAAGAAAAEKTA